MPLSPAQQATLDHLAASSKREDSASLRDLDALLDALATAPSEEVAHALSVLAARLPKITLIGPFSALKGDQFDRAHTIAHGALNDKVMQLGLAHAGHGAALHAFSLVNDYLTFHRDREEHKFGRIWYTYAQSTPTYEALLAAAMAEQTPLDARLALAFKHPDNASPHLPALLDACDHELLARWASPTIELLAAYNSKLELSPQSFARVWPLAPEHARLTLLTTAREDNVLAMRAHTLAWLPTIAQLHASHPERTAALALGDLLTPPQRHHIALASLSTPHPDHLDAALQALDPALLTRDDLAPLASARPHASRAARNAIDALIAAIHAAHPMPGDADGALSIAQDGPAGALSLAALAEHGALSLPGEASASLAAASLAPRDAMVAMWRRLGPAPRRLAPSAAIALLGVGPGFVMAPLWLVLALAAAIPPGASDWLWAAWTLALVIIALYAWFNDEHPLGEVHELLTRGQLVQAAVRDKSFGSYASLRIPGGEETTVWGVTPDLPLDAPVPILRIKSKYSQYTTCRAVERDRLLRVNDRGRIVAHTPHLITSLALILSALAALLWRLL